MNDLQRRVLAETIIKEFRLGIRTHRNEKYTFNKINKHVFTIEKCRINNSICGYDMRNLCTHCVLGDPLRLCISELHFPLINKKEE